MSDKTEISEVSKAALQRAKLKSHAKFRANGGIEAEDKPTEKKESFELDEMQSVSNKSDHDVLRAFANKQSHQSKKLSTDGKTLHGNWMGGHSIAHWDGNKVRLRTASSRSEQSVHRALTKKHLAPHDMHESELNELGPRTLKSYIKKSDGTGPRSSWGLNQKGDKEEDKSMSTDGNKYPEKQERHQKAASKLFHKAQNRIKGAALAAKKINTREETEIDEMWKASVSDEGKHVLKHKSGKVSSKVYGSKEEAIQAAVRKNRVSGAFKEDITIVDECMTLDEIEVNRFIDSIEVRIDNTVDALKEEMRVRLFSMVENKYEVARKLASNDDRPLRKKVKDGLPGRWSKPTPVGDQGHTMRIKVPHKKYIDAAKKGG